MTNLPKHIEDLRTAVRALPNCEERNAILSGLRTALYAAREYDRTHQTDQCTCPEGAVDGDCPVHNPNK